MSLHELKVSSKTGEQRRRQQRQAEKAARGSGQRGSHAGRSFEEVDVNEAELQGVPVLWVQVRGLAAWLPGFAVCRLYVFDGEGRGISVDTFTAGALHTHSIG